MRKPSATSVKTDIFHGVDYSFPEEKLLELKSILSLGKFYLSLLFYATLLL